MIQQVQLVGCGREVAACQLTGFRRRHGEHQQWPLEARGAELVVPAQGAGEGGAAERVCALRVHRAEARGLALGGADPHPAVAAGADELVDAHALSLRCRVITAPTSACRAARCWR